MKTSWRRVAEAMQIKVSGWCKGLLCQGLPLCVLTASSDSAIPLNYSQVHQQVKNVFCRMQELLWKSVGGSVKLLKCSFEGLPWESQFCSHGFLDFRSVWQDADDSSLHSSAKLCPPNSDGVYQKHSNGMLFFTVEVGQTASGFFLFSQRKIGETSLLTRVS